jgi:acyl-CoA synthetase (AMP-forming)/AMP-acid ligase II
MYPGAHDPQSPAIVMAGDGTTVTYGELDANANRIHHLLRSWGVAAQDHVALVIENRPAFFDVAWGAHYAGTYYTAISTRLTAEEIAYIVTDCDAKVVFLSATYADVAQDVREACPQVEHWVAVGGAIAGYEPLDELLAAQPATPVEEQRLAGKDMLYSSGTTGRPKGIRPVDLTVPLEEAPIIVTGILANMFGVGAEDVYLSPAPLYHAAPLRFCMSHHQLGAKVVVQERFDEAEVLELIDAHGVTVAQFVPTMFVRMLRLPEDVRAAADVSRLKLVLHAAAPCPPDVKAAMLDWFGDVIHEYYASTEGCGLTWVRPEEWRSKPGTVGKALIGVVHIVDDEGNELGPGETGSVSFSDGPQFEYHKDPEKTAGAYDERGWASFGDFGHVDEDGFLFLTDRKSFMIISGGVNIYPQESEDALLSHPKVADAAVFGIPHPEWGEEVKAVVQPVEMPADDAAAAALEAELLAHLHGRMAKNKCPRTIDFRPELPRHDTGKLYKRQLKEEYAAAATA